MSKDKDLLILLRNDVFHDYCEIGSELNDLRARAIVVDMEESVIHNKILNGDLKDIFESRMCITDQGGAGNNWA